MRTMATAERGETAATRETGGPKGPVDVAWLILERLGDIKEQLADLRRAQDKLDAKIDQQGKEVRADIQRLDAKIDGVADKLVAKIDNLRNYIVIPVVLVLLAAVLAHFVPGL